VRCEVRQPGAKSSGLGHIIIMGLFYNKVDRSELKAGDHVYTWRRAYTYAHHGVYVKGNKVVHFTRGECQELGTRTILDSFVNCSTPTRSLICLDCGFERENSGVTLSCLDCFLAGGCLYRFEYGVNPAVFLAKARGGTCTLAESDPPETVIHRATYLLQNGFGNYDIFENNCEDFAMFCKTGLLVEKSGLGRSGQAASFIGVPFAAILSSPLGLLLSGPGVATVTAGLYCLSRYATDIGIRTDVAKASVEHLAVNHGQSTGSEPSLVESSRTQAISRNISSIDSTEDCQLFQGSVPK